ncbi:MAG: hypothetical protein AAF591_17105 [Verrucomicrobiota bacterium]
MMKVIGRAHIQDYDAFEPDFREHSKDTHEFALRFLPPYGWIALARIEHKKNAILYASENLSLPEGERFKDDPRTKKYGFDPAERSDDQITRRLMEKHLW